MVRPEFRADHAKRHANLQHSDGGTFVSVRRLLREIRKLLNVEVVISGRADVVFITLLVNQSHARIGDDMPDSHNLDGTAPGRRFEGHG